MSAFAEALSQIARRRAEQQQLLAQAEQQSMAKPKISDLAKTIAATALARGGGDALAKEFGGVMPDITGGIKEQFGGLTDILSGAKDSIGSAFGYEPTQLASSATTDYAPSLLNDYGIGGGYEQSLLDSYGLGNTELSTGASEAASTGMSGLGTALSLAGIAHGGYNLFDDFGEGDWKSGALSGAEVGAGLGSFFPGVGTLVGGGIGALAGGLLGAAKTGKTNEGTKRRDSVRSFLASKGVGPKEDYLSLPGGGEYDIGGEGGGSGAYNVDQTNPLAAQASGLLNPLGETVTSGDDTGARQTTGMFTNAALQGATDEKTLIDNVRYQYQQAGITKDEGFRALRRLRDAGRITEDERMAYENSLNKVFG